MLYHIQVEHKDMNLSVLTWFALPFSMVSAVMNGKNLLVFCYTQQALPEVWVYHCHVYHCFGSSGDVDK